MLSQVTARPQSPALTPAIEALVEKAVETLRPMQPRWTRPILRSLALAVAEEAARGERERCETAIREACSMCNGKGGIETVRPSHAPDCDGRCRNCPIPVYDAEECEYCGRPIAAIRGGADAESE